MSATKPPGWARWLLQRTCKDEHLDELQGDLLELFDRDVQRLGPKKARRAFGLRVLMSPRWYRMMGFGKINSGFMGHKYLKIAWRNAARYRVSTFIQFLGLCLGFASAVFFLLFLTY